MEVLVIRAFNETGRETDMSQQSSNLFYHGAATEVRLGDRVRLRRFFRPDQSGVVCYIPGLSPNHSELEYEDVRQWAIRADDGSVYPIVYDPENFQPPKRICFVSRGTGGELTPDETLL